MQECVLVCACAANLLGVNVRVESNGACSGDSVSDFAESKKCSKHEYERVNTVLHSILQIQYCIFWRYSYIFAYTLLLHFDCTVL